MLYSLYPLTAYAFANMSTLILLNKPYQVLSQFSDTEGRQTLAHYVQQQHVYPAGRLDYDSEGLLLLTDDGQLQHQIANPLHKLPKTYWAQVEGEADQHAVKQLCEGVTLKDGNTRPAEVSVMPEPNIWPRTPPVRERKTIPTHWLSITITEGRNRQVRRMTAAVGLPTLRLIRAQIGQWSLGTLQPGETHTMEVHLPAANAAKETRPKTTPRNRKSNMTKKHIRKKPSRRNQP